MISERNFAAAIGTIHAVGAPVLSCLTRPGAGPFALTPTSLRAPKRRWRRPAPVAGGIPGFDRTGQKVIAGTFRVNDAPLS